MTDPFGFRAQYAPELQHMLHDINEFQAHPENARKHDLKTLMKSLQHHGQRAAIVVQAETGYIVKGNGTWQAARNLGWDKIVASVQSMTDEEALTFLFADNRASDQSTYDRQRLHAGLQKLVDGPGLWDATCWEIEEFADLDDELSQSVLGADGLVVDARYTGSEVERQAAAEKAAKEYVGEKMREVPLVLTVTDHATFIENIKILQRAYGTSGNIATILEAVRRAADVIRGTADEPVQRRSGSVDYYEPPVAAAAPVYETEADIVRATAALFSEQWDDEKADA